MKKFMLRKVIYNVNKVKNVCGRGCRCIICDKVPTSNNYTDWKGSYVLCKGEGGGLCEYIILSLLCV